MHWFALASLTPAVLLVCGALWGGLWPALGVLSITALVFVLDRPLARLLPDTSGQSGRAVSLAQTGAHGVLWILGIAAVATGEHLSATNTALMIIGLGLYFGQISNSNAHELIHAPDKALHRIGVAMYCSLLFGHHTSSHRRVHHVYAATAKDPNTARLGEGFWRYFVRAWPAGFLAGKKAEDTLRARHSGPQSNAVHPYTVYLLGTCCAVAMAAMLGGLRGVAALLVIALYAQVQLYLSDYVQHYGLVRDVTDDGTFAPMGSEHSWNAPHWYSSAMMLNAPRHSDHHAHPLRPFPDLQLTPDTMPTLPHSLPVMAVLALAPPVWRRVMDPRAQAWRRASGC